LVSLSQRYYNPYQCAPLLYTRNLWMSGVDEFIAPGENGGEAKKKKISLYQWIHLSPDQRSEYLFKYARGITEDEVKDMKEFDDPLRSVISVSYCVDTQAITDYALAKTVPRKLGMPHGVHGMIQKCANGKFEVAWKRVIGCGSGKDLELEHVQYLVDHHHADVAWKEADLPDTLSPKERYDREEKVEKENLESMRKALCSGKVDVLSEEGKAFIVGCGLKWHMLAEDEKSSKSINNLQVDAKVMEKWPQVYMNHMKKWNHEDFTNADIKWEDRVKSDHNDIVEKLGLHLFWAGSEGGHPEKDYLLKNCRWEGQVEQYMVLESNAEWMAARQLLGLASLKDARRKPPPKEKK